MKKKGTRSISEAIRMAWNDMDNTTDYRSTVFHAPCLCSRIRAYTNTGVMDGTTLRVLRKMRQAGKLDYKVINNETSQYQKLW